MQNILAVLRFLGNWSDLADEYSDVSRRNQKYVSDHIFDHIFFHIHDKISLHRASYRILLWYSTWKLFIFRERKETSPSINSLCIVYSWQKFYHLFSSGKLECTKHMFEIHIQTCTLLCDMSVYTLSKMLFNLHVLI